MKDLRARLEKRIGSGVSDILHVVDRYGLSPNIRNFDNHGFLLHDKVKRTVRIVSGSFENDVIHLQPFPSADIVIVFVDNMCLGWAERHEFIDADNIMMIKTKSLQPMPDDFSFSRSCPHLEEYGGFLQDSYWECIGCGSLIKAGVDV